ncbi:helix-turn-helix domain containing protein [Tsukamurella sp. 8F]|uniref:TetR/AcrR family transcriptional regulator n=1 Tax=unclassified Tsukamurella TaxID=2633480 RepID=UPI0023BA31AF|nr:MULTISPECIES: TetR/AcrR family transcriptional regulator [unclassified Tsukamurella]MDF0532384.1 helix-turn-helix domain containing protein [Tsukamurella sp. 8J]MDF0588630.1 helix-turn-helix domain containing protein [Tsukamurella sp. 8F]
MPNPAETGKPAARRPSPSRRIVDAAREVIAVHGIPGTSMDLIAKQAHVSRSTLYRIFPNRDQLIARVVTIEIRTLRRRLDKAIVGFTPRQALVEVFVLGLEQAEANLAVSKVLAAEPEYFLRLPPWVWDILIQGVVIRLRNSGAEQPYAELCAVTDLMLRIAGSLLSNPTAALDISDHAALRAYGEKYISRLLVD